MATSPSSSGGLPSAALRHTVVASFEQVAPANAADYDADEMDTSTYVFDVARSMDDSQYAASLSTHTAAASAQVPVVAPRPRRPWQRCLRTR